MLAVLCQKPGQSLGTRLLTVYVAVHTKTNKKSCSVAVTTSVEAVNSMFRLSFVFTTHTGLIYFVNLLMVRRESYFLTPNIANMASVLR